LDLVGLALYDIVIFVGKPLTVLAPATCMLYSSMTASGRPKSLSSPIIVLYCTVVSPQSDHPNSEQFLKVTGFRGDALSYKNVTHKANIVPTKRT
jgi:hypothetical protein